MKTNHISKKQTKKEKAQETHTDAEKHTVTHVEIP